MEQLQTAINRYETCLPTEKRWMMNILVRALGPANEEMRKQVRRLDRSWDQLSARCRYAEVRLPAVTICNKCGGDIE